MTSVWFKAAVSWLVILMLAILNGVLREYILVPDLGDFAGLLSSGVLLAVSIFVVTLIFVPWYGRLATRQWILVGMFWLLLTLVFEFGFGRVIQQKTWAELFFAYTFQGGNIWPIVLVTTFVSPWLAAKMRGLI